MLRTIQEIKGLKGKRVFLRTDFNVPLKDGRVSDENRIIESLPTIKHLIKAGAKVIIGSHLGRPSSSSDHATSLKPVQKVLEKLLKMKVVISPEVVGGKTTKLMESLQPGEVLMLENLRWEKGEEADSEEFAKELAKLADIYVNDAFAVSHRPHASVFTIAKHLPSYAGFLIEKEIENLSKLLGKVQSPFILILGGAKIADKIGVIDNLAEKVDRILIGGAMGNTFLVSQSVDISKSLFEEGALDQAREYLTKYQDKIQLPVDNLKKEVEGGFSYLDIGPATINNYTKIIAGAKTIFWNGNLGFTEEKEFAFGTEKIALAIAKNRNCFSVIAGGDTVGAIDEMNLKSKFSFVSTGGGASLEFLAGKELPGIKALEL